MHPISLLRTIRQTLLAASPRHGNMGLILQSFLPFYLFLSYNDDRVEKHSRGPLEERRINSSPSLKPDPGDECGLIGVEALN